MSYHDDFGWDYRPFGSFGNDRVTVEADGNVVFTGFGRDTVRVRADDVTVDLGFGKDVARTYGDDAVVNGGFGRDRLLGGDGTDSLWGNFGDDVIRTGKGADYALGNQGNDLTDTGEGLGIHFGGAGADTFFIGQEIVANNAQDTVIALDFGNGHDRLDIAPEILTNVASIAEGKVDLVPVLAAFEAEGLSVPEVGQRLSQTFLGDLAFREVARFLEQFPPNAQGQVLVDATTVRTNEGDTIIALGVTQDQLLAAIG